MLLLLSALSALINQYALLLTTIYTATNAWLYIKDDPEAETPKGCCMTDNMANKLIAFIIDSLFSTLFT